MNRPLWISLWAASLIWAAPVLAGEVIDQIKIEVYNQAITEHEIELRVQARQGGPASGLNLLANERARAEVTEELINEALLDHRAESLNIQISPEEVDQGVDKFRTQQGLTERRFEDSLEYQHITLADFKQRIEERLKRERVMQQEVGSQISINEELLKQEHLKNTPVVEKVHARHLLILAKKTAPKAEIEAARKRILALREQITSGANFGELAAKNSEDPLAADNQGDLGFFKKEDMDPDFADAAFNLPPGQLSGPVRSRFGFHLIEVLEKKKMPVIPFAQVRDQLHSREYQAQYQNKAEAYLKELRDNATIVYR
ncbi:MAG: peptidylprolyl isomerase [bacterium]|nr:peptidylprolyl isomerase [bacterium]